MNDLLDHAINGGMLLGVVMGACWYISTRLASIENVANNALIAIQEHLKRYEHDGRKMDERIHNLESRPSVAPRDADPPYPRSRMRKGN